MTIHLLLMPLLIVNSSRLEDQISAQISSQLTQQLLGLEQLENKVKKGTAEDINDVVARLKGGRLVNIKNPQELKSKLLSEVTKAKNTIKSQVEAVGAEQRLNLLKKSAKWFLGVLIAGVLFIYMAAL